MTTLKGLLDAIHESVELSSASEIKTACDIIIRVQAMSGAEKDTLRAAWTCGPLDDGDVPSKNARDTLVQDGFMVRVVVRGEQGYNACTYKGHAAYRLIEAGA